MSHLEISVLFGAEAQSPMELNLSWTQASFSSTKVLRSISASVMHHRLQKTPTNDKALII